MKAALKIVCVCVVVTALGFAIWLVSSRGGLVPFAPSQAGGAPTPYAVARSLLRKERDFFSKMDRGWDLDRNEKRKKADVSCRDATLGWEQAAAALVAAIKRVAEEPMVSANVEAADRLIDERNDWQSKRDFAELELLLVSPFPSIVAERRIQALRADIERLRGSKATANLDVQLFPKQMPLKTLIERSNADQIRDAQSTIDSINRIEPLVRSTVPREFWTLRKVVSPVIVELEYQENLPTEKAVTRLVRLADLEEAPSTDRKQALDTLHRVLSGNTISLEFRSVSQSTFDRDGAVVAYLFVSGDCVNLELARLHLARYSDTWSEQRYSEAIRMLSDSKP